MYGISVEIFFIVKQLIGSDCVSDFTTVESEIIVTYFIY